MRIFYDAAFTCEKADTFTITYWKRIGKVCVTHLALPTDLARMSLISHVCLGFVARVLQ